MRGVLSVRGVVYEELSGGVLGYYDHTDGLIKVDPRPKRRRRHVTIVHEAFHRVMQHGEDILPKRVSREIVVEHMTAMYFISFRDLLDAFVQCGSVDEMARFLNVDNGLIYARFLALTALEQTILNVCGRNCIGIDYREPVRSDLAVVA